MHALEDHKQDEQAPSLQSNQQRDSEHLSRHQGWGLQRHVEVLRLQTALESLKYVSSEWWQDKKFS